MKFSEFPFYKPDINEVKKNFDLLFKDFTSSESFDEQNKVFLEINELIKEFETLYGIAALRFSSDSTRSDFEADKEHFDNISPEYDTYLMKYYKLLSESPFIEQYEKRYGKNLTATAKRRVMLFSDEVKDESRIEMELETEFSKIKSQTVLEIDGKKINGTALGKYLTLPDRNKRKEVSDALLKAAEAGKEKIDEIFDNLIKIRTQTAHKLGFKNYVDLAYLNMNKEFTPKDIAQFRNHISKYVSPILAKLRERQRERLGVDKLMHYDAMIKFKSGNPMPKGDVDWIVQQAVKMYSEMSSVTKEFIEYMTENELLDLYNRTGKMSGGFSCFFAKHKAPFIFANMTGTATDIDLFTHEAGHAFHSYLCKDFAIEEESSVTSDVDEVHSMTMEFMTRDYAHLFFEKEHLDKFHFEHLSNSIRFIALNALGDEFQEIIYSDLSIDHSARAALWAKLQDKYTPGVDYGKFDKGYQWQTKSLFFSHPFYTIEYALAQFAAYEFYFMYKENPEETFNKYVEFCKLGGRYTFSEALKYAGLKNPFEEETVKELTEKVEALINSYDDSKF